MKKFTLLLLSALLYVASAVAQTPYGSIEKEGDSYLKNRKANTNTRIVKKATKVNGIRKAEDGLTAMFDQPEGELMLMRRSGIDYLDYYGTPAPANYEAKGTYVVKGTDGNYYFKNFITNMCNGGAWVKGTVEGDIISIATGQICTQLWYYNGYSTDLYTYYLYALDSETHTEYDEYWGYEYEVTEYSVNTEVEAIKFRINEDGTLTSLDDELLYGGVEDVDGDGDLTWPGYGDKGCTFYPFNEVAQTAPEGTVFEDYLCEDLLFGKPQYRFIKVAVDNNRFYLKGLNEIIPEGVVIGRIDGESAVVNTNQFMGVDEKYSTLVYAKAAEQVVTEDEWGWQTYSFEEIDKMVFTYQPKSKSLASTDCLLLNAGKNEILHHDQYCGPKLNLWEEKALVPSAPVVTQYMPFTEAEWGSWGYVGFDINTTDDNGNYLLPEKLYYTVFFDGEPLEVENEEDGSTFTEIPFDFMSYDIVGGSVSHFVYFYEGDYESLGIQSIYYGADVRNVSTITYAEGDPAGISATQAPVESKTIVDAQGRKRNALTRGLNIVTVRHADGTTKSAKIFVK